MWIGLDIIPFRFCVKLSLHLEHAQLDGTLFATLKPQSWLCAKQTSSLRSSFFGASLFREIKNLGFF